MPDPFLPVLENFRLDQISLADGEHTPPWSWEIKPSQGLHCYMVTGQPARLNVPPHVDEVIRPGDLAIVFEGAGHVVEPLADRGTTRLMYSHQQYDRDRISPLLRLLPAAVIARGEGGQPSPDLAPVVSMFRMINSPMRPTDMSVLLRLSELTFIQIVHQHLDQVIPPDERRLLGRDLFNVGPALAAMRRDLKRDWTLPEICREAAVSKTRLTEIFSRTLEQSPKKFLTGLRMREAANLLENDLLSISQIAHRVGYTSDAPFNRAFKRQFGAPPGVYRSEARRRVGRPGAALGDERAG